MLAMIFRWGIGMCQNLEGDCLKFSLITVLRPKPYRYGAPLVANRYNPKNLEMVKSKIYRYTIEYYK